MLGCFSRCSASISTAACADTPSRSARRPCLRASIRARAPRLVTVPAALRIRLTRGITLAAYGLPDTTSTQYRTSLALCDVTWGRPRQRNRTTATAHEQSLQLVPLTADSRWYTLYPSHSANKVMRLGRRSASLSAPGGESRPSLLPCTRAKAKESPWRLLLASPRCHGNKSPRNDSGPCSPPPRALPESPRCPLPAALAVFVSPSPAVLMFTTAAVPVPPCVRPLRQQLPMILLRPLR